MRNDKPVNRFLNGPAIFFWRFGDNELSLWRQRGACRIGDAEMIPSEPDAVSTAEGMLSSPQRRL